MWGGAAALYLFVHGRRRSSYYLNQAMKAWFFGGRSSAPPFIASPTREHVQTYRQRREQGGNRIIAAFSGGR